MVVLLSTPKTLHTEGQDAAWRFFFSFLFLFGGGVFLFFGVGKGRCWVRSFTDQHLHSATFMVFPKQSFTSISDLVSIFFLYHVCAIYLAMLNRVAKIVGAA